MEKEFISEQEAVALLRPIVKPTVPATGKEGC